MTPLDLPAQIALLDSTLSQYPAAETSLRPILNRCLELSGVRDLQTLQTRKAAGLSVFGQVPAYATGSSADVNELIGSIQAAIANLPTVVAPNSAPIAYNAAEYPAIVIPSAVAGLADFNYQPPLK